MSAYTRKRPSATIRCPHKGCKFGRIKFYDEQPDGIDKAKAYFALFRMWLNHEKRHHRGHLSFAPVVNREPGLLPEPSQISE